MANSILIPANEGFVSDFLYTLIHSLKNE